MDELVMEETELDETELEDPSFDADKDYSKKELEEWADQLLREDANRELCRRCKTAAPKSIPYGDETGHVEWQIQKDKEGNPLFDDEGNTLYVGFPELQCDEGHRWYKGEGPRRDIRGLNPILFETHLYNRKRREIHVKDGIPDPAFTMDRWGKRPTTGIYNRCVDELTEALTPQGWRQYDQLQRGDRVWAYDIEIDQYEWQPVTDIYTVVYKGPLSVLESQNISARFTPGHRWPVVHERNKDCRYEVTTLRARHYIPLARSPKPQPLGDNHSLFELLGWVLTDGTYRKGRNDARVYQALHNPKVVHLQRCLEANGLNPLPQFVDSNNVGRWAIPVLVGKPLRALTGNIKKIAQVDLAAFTTDQYEALWRGIRFGDGYVRDVCPLGEISSTDPKESNAIQALAARLGITSYSFHNHQARAFCPDMYPVRCKKVQWAYVRAALQEDEWYDGIVWCPSIPSGFWLARRKGKVFTTGNSHPQGRKINTPLQRARNGASWYR